MANAPEHIRDWLAAQRQHAYELAEAVPVTAETMSRWLCGHRVPPAPIRHRLADITGLPVRDAESWGQSKGVEAAE